jgi:hypothetical protein
MERPSDIQGLIEAADGVGNYEPEVLAQEKITIQKRTRIKLRDLKKNAPGHCDCTPATPRPPLQRYNGKRATTASRHSRGNMWSDTAFG